MGLFGALVALCLDSEVWLLSALLILLLLVVMLFGLIFLLVILRCCCFFLSDNLQYLENNSDNLQYLEIISDNLQCLERRTAWILPFSAGGFLNIGRVSQ